MIKVFVRISKRFSIWCPWADSSNNGSCLTCHLVVHHQEGWRWTMTDWENMSVVTLRTEQTPCVNLVGDRARKCLQPAARKVSSVWTAEKFCLASGFPDLTHIVIPKQNCAESAWFDEHINTYGLWASKNDVSCAACKQTYEGWAANPLVNQ